MKRLWMSGAAAVMALSIASLGAQTPQTPPPQSQPPQPQPQTQQPATTQNMVTATLQGCVYKEADIPGRTPNVAEKAGVLEDYILVTSASPSATAGTSGTTPPSPTAGAAAAKMANKAFKLEKIADERLKAVVGKRVEVTGRVDAEHGDAKTAGAPAADKSLGPDKIELPEFEVTTIREVEGTCPTTPEIRK